MIKRTLILVLAFAGLQTQAQDFWIKRDSVNGPPRAACASFVLNGEGFVATGLNLEEAKRKLYSYDLDQDDWDNEISLGGEAGTGLERGSAIGFSAGGYGFIGLGNGTAALMNDLWRYDPESESWTQMADFEGEPRSGAVAFAIDLIGYVGTGQSESGLHADFYRYLVETNTWEELDDFEGAARKEAVGFTMGGKAYVGTGRSDSGYLKDFWEYTPSTDSWEQKADFPGTPRMGAAGCGVFPSAYVMLGEDYSFAYKEDVWEWNYFGNVWTQRADFMGGERTQATAFAVDGRVFAGLGYNGTYHDDFYEYDRVLSYENYTEAFRIKLYPNPATTSLNIELSKPLKSIQVFNSQGQVMKGLIEQTSQNQKSIQLSGLDQLAPGLYFIQLITSEGQTYNSSIQIQ